MLFKEQPDVKSVTSGEAVGDSAVFDVRNPLRPSGGLEVPLGRPLCGG